MNVIMMMRGIIGRDKQYRSNLQEKILIQGKIITFYLIGVKQWRRGSRCRDNDPSSDEDDDNRNNHQREYMIRTNKKKSNRKTEDDSNPSSDNELIQVRKPGRVNNKWIKPEKFDGRGCWQTFLLQFQNCAKYNNWSDDDKEAHLRWSMSGAATQILWKTEKLNYEQLVLKLSDRFSCRGIEVKYENELRSRRREKNETLKELAQDIQRGIFGEKRLNGSDPFPMWKSIKTGLKRD